MTRTTGILGAALLVSLALAATTSTSAGEALVKDASQHASLMSKLRPAAPASSNQPVQQAKARSARSLSDMFEKVKSKIFGGRKQSAGSQVAASSSSVSSQAQPSASINPAQRQPWTDLNAFNQQYNPYLTTGNQYQWPAASASGNQFASNFGQQYNPLGGFSSVPSGSNGFQQPGGSASSAGNGQLMAGLDQSSAFNQASLQQAVGGPSAAANPAPGGSNLFSSASHLIAQYLSPGSSSSGSGSSSSSSGSSGSPAGGSSSGGQQQSSLLTPQQQQQQAQYQEFASILDSMVAQTGASIQRNQPAGINQYLNGQPGIQQQQQQQPAQQPGSGFQVGPSANGMDQDMSGSSSVQSYLQPGGAGQQQAAASQKSSMVGLAEQLAPGSNFNKLVSFPFSLTTNDDPSKEGRYKLHIPFLNQHVKRSDQQQQVAGGANSVGQQQQRAQQQQLQQYLNSYYNQQQQQQQLYTSAQSAPGQPQMSQSSSSQQQLAAQSSQVVPTIVSPSSSSASSSSSPTSSSSSSSSSSASSAIAQSAPISQATSVSSSSSSSSSVSSIPSSSSSSSSVVQQSNSPAVSSSVSAGQSAQSRPSWSVVDLQSGQPSSAKLIPIQAAAQADSLSQNN